MKIAQTEIELEEMATDLIRNGLTEEEFVKAFSVTGKQRRDLYVQWRKQNNISDVSSEFERDGCMMPADPESGSPLYDLTLNGTYPEEVYSASGLKYYSTGEPQMDNEAYSLVLAAEGKPTKRIRVYRAVEKSSNAKIQPGDWVTTVRQYAVEHGKGNISRGDFKIISAVVYAKDLFTEGDSWLEYGYHPQTHTLSFRPIRAMYKRIKSKLAGEVSPQIPQTPSSNQPSDNTLTDTIM